MLTNISRSVGLVRLVGISGVVAVSMRVSQAECQGVGLSSTTGVRNEERFNM